MIIELKDLMIAHTNTVNSHSCPSTPRKMNRSGKVSVTPKTPKNMFAGLVAAAGEGKENLSPLVTSPKVNILRPRNL